MCSGVCLSQLVQSVERKCFTVASVQPLYVASALFENSAASKRSFRLLFCVSVQSWDLRVSCQAYDNPHYSNRTHLWQITQLSPYFQRSFNIHVKAQREAAWGNQHVHVICACRRRGANMELCVEQAMVAPCMCFWHSSIGCSWA